MTNDELLSSGLALADYTHSIRSLRNAREMSRHTLAYLSDIDEGRLDRIETQAQPMSEDDLRAIAGVLEVDRYELKAMLYGPCLLRYWVESKRADPLTGTMYCCWCDDGAEPCPQTTPERISAFCAFIRRQQHARELRATDATKRRAWTGRAGRLAAALGDTTTQQLG
jgi:hypothetical protein